MLGNTNKLGSIKLENSNEQNMEDSVFNTQLSSQNTLDVISNLGSQMSEEQIITAKNSLMNNANLFNNSINQINNSANQSVNNLRAVSNNLANQQIVTDILQTEVDNAERSYTGLKQDNNDKLRMIQINTYYTEKYKAHTNLMKKIIYFILPILLITILGNKEIIPKNLAYTIAGIILIIGIIVVLYNIYDLNNRNNLDFNEYIIDSHSSLKDVSGNTHDISETETILDRVHDKIFNKDCPSCPQPNESESSLFSTVGGNCAYNFSHTNQTIHEGMPITCPEEAPNCIGNETGIKWGKCKK